MLDRRGAALASSWSAQLGLAYSPLFGGARGRAGDHFALRDGADGSFALSTVPVEVRESLDWTWSSQLGSHVEVGEEVVRVRQLDSRAPVLQFQRGAVDQHLDRFLDAVIERRAPPAVTVVDHVASCFRSHRATAAKVGLSPEAALASFLDLLAQTIEPDKGEPPRLAAVRDRLPGGYSERFHEELTYNQLTGRHADLQLTIRHAAGTLFQEAHAALASEPAQPSLFGLAHVPKVTTENTLGAYYTPPGLAQTLADLAVKPYLHQPQIRVLDPACGSGIFLCEALRSLQRYEYDGVVELSGYDVSASAIEMARFAVEHGGLLPGPVVTRFQVADFLAAAPSMTADVILMNPPFMAHQDLDAERQALMQRSLGHLVKYRPDLSVLFASHALANLSPGGTLATLLPSGALSQRSAAGWRKGIAHANSLDLVAVLGDHGLFRDAMVNVAALVLRKEEPLPITAPTMLWASQKVGASAAALRRLRRWADGDHRAERTNDWAIYPATPARILEGEDWLPRPNNLGSLPTRLRETSGVVRASDLFHIELGIRSGDRKTFIIGRDVHEALPADERTFFRPIAEKGAIKGGRIKAANFLFYPAAPMTVAEARRRLPKFFEHHLSKRALPPDQPLALARPRRNTMDSRGPRIVSRTYIGAGSFAVDPDGSHVVVQGFSWLPKPPVADAPFDLTALLTDYCFLFNSRLFFLLVYELGRRIVGGGQVEADKQGMKAVPVPDLARLYLEDPELKRIADELRAIDAREYPSVANLDRFAALAYRTKLEEWPSASQS